jgi:hypothetical protein
LDAASADLLFPIAKPLDLMVELTFPVPRPLKLVQSPLLIAVAVSNTTPDFATKNATPDTMELVQFAGLTLLLAGSAAVWAMPKIAKLAKA